MDESPGVKLGLFLCMGVRRPCFIDWLEHPSAKHVGICREKCGKLEMRNTRRWYIHRHPSDLKRSLNRFGDLILGYVVAQGMAQWPHHPKRF